MKKTNRKWVTISVMGAMFLSAMEATIVSTAMSTIVGKLGGFSQFTWVFSIFLLAQAVSVPVYGKLADLRGRKPIFVTGAGLFIVGSGLCSLASSMPQLIIFRGVQGLGAGAVLSIAVTIIGDLYPGKERAKVQGLLSSMWAVAAVIGPALGGIIVQTIGWPWVFALNVPLGLVTILGVVIFLHEHIERRSHKIDYLGSLTMAVGVGALLIVLLHAGVKWSWFSPKTTGLLTVSALFFIAFMLIEMRAKEPVLPLTLMRQRSISIPNLCAIITGGLTIGTASFLPVYAQGVLGVNPIIAGSTIMTISIGWPLAAALSARLIWRFGYRAIEVAGMVFCALGSALYLGISPSIHPLYISLSSFVVGIGLGLASTTQIVSAQTSVPWQQRGVATSSIMFSRIFGGILWVALLGTVVNTSLARALAGTGLASKYGVGDSISITNLLLDHKKRELISGDHLGILTNALADSIHSTFWVLLVSALIGIWVAAYMLGGVPDKDGKLANLRDKAS